MKLAVIIPALNEEEGIESIISRSLAAREFICRKSPVTEVEITVVSDGSTDRTVEIASRFASQVRLVVFPKNRGYGAAIKEGWNQSDAELLGFLDADGTCDPMFFASLCSRLEETGADVVLGCRLTSTSRMPLIRRLGNTIFAVLLSLFSDSRVRDTASGMRVVRRSSLDNLYPLPDGLHFTPAMSARAMLSQTLRIDEVDMPYEERLGESKLRIIGDGLRFLKVILETAFLYRPSRPFTVLGLLLLLAAVMLMAQPIVHYVQHRSVLEWMIYRFLVSYLFGFTSCLCFATSYLMARIVGLTLSGEIAGTGLDLVARFFASRRFWLLPVGLVLVGGLLVLGSFLDLLRRGETYEHWSRYVVMIFCFSTAALLTVTRGIDYMLGLVGERMSYWRSIRSLRNDATTVDVSTSSKCGGVS